MHVASVSQPNMGLEPYSHESPAFVQLLFSIGIVAGQPHCTGRSTQMAG
jgi:hypothetical protein